MDGFLEIARRQWFKDKGNIRARGNPIKGVRGGDHQI